MHPHGVTSPARLTTRLGAAALLVLVASCGGRAAGPPASPSAPASPTSASSDTSASEPAPSAPAPSASTRSATPARSPSPRAARVTKLLVVVVENHSLDQMRAGMPYTFGLAERFGYADQYFAITHPSLPNYLAIAGGATYGVRDDGPPSEHPLQGTSVFQQALDQGRTAGVYAEAMPSNCATEPQGDYAVKHNPWAYFVQERDRCRAFDLPFAALAPAVSAGRLPNAGMVVPDLCHDAHNCDLSVADGWFRSLMTRVFAGPDWRSGRLAVVLTADEDDHNQDNRVLTVVIHPSQRGHVVTSRLDHYSLTRLYDEVLGAPYLAGAASAASMATAFGLPVR